MSDQDQPAALDMFARAFLADAPEPGCVGDAAGCVIGAKDELCLATASGVLSRFVVGWTVGAVNDRGLVIRVFDQSRQQRCPLYLVYPAFRSSQSLR